MKKFLKIILIAICFSVLATSVVVSTSCSSIWTAETLTTVSYFNTETKVVLMDKFDSEKTKKKEECWSKIKQTLSDIENDISIYKENSDIYKFNHSLGDEWIELSKNSYDVLSYAIDTYEKTNGAYNPATALLSDLWGFTDRFTRSNYTASEPYDRENYETTLPDVTYINGFKSLAQFGDVEIKIEEGKYYIFKPSTHVEIGGITYYMQIDLGGVGKGYAVDKIKSIISNCGFVYGYISIGTSSMYVLSRNNKDENWNIKIVHPRLDSKYYITLCSKKIGISTSGDYENYYAIGDTRYCHIINPQTGAPISNGICTASVFLDSAALADAYSTALCVMTKEQAISFIENNLDFAAFVYYNETTEKYEIYTNVSSENYSLDDKTFEIKAIISEHQ